MSLGRRLTRGGITSGIPQPAGWGSFTLTYKGDAAGRSEIPQRVRLGDFWPGALLGVKEPAATLWSRRRQLPLCLPLQPRH
jgi:hypothetical protein